MTENLDIRKLKLIEKITLLFQENEISRLEKFFEFQEKNAEIFKPVRKYLTVEQLRNEQNYQGFNREKFDQLVLELDIQESLDELLAMLD